MSRKWKSLILLFLLLPGCAGRTPNPVAMYQPGDNTLSCEGLRIQMGYCQEQIATLLPKSDKTGQNVFLGIAGAFLLFPWFFMDFSDADRVEVEAWRARNNYLTSLFVDKDCGNRMMMPSLDQLKDDEDTRTSWAEQVEIDQEYLHESQSATFAELDAAAKQSNVALQSKAKSLGSDSSDSILVLSPEEFGKAKDRLLSLYTEGAIDKNDFDRELQQLKAARDAFDAQGDQGSGTD